MSHNHSHGEGHSHGSEKADGWTNLSTVAEVATSVISDAYLLASYFDIATGFAADALGLSYYAMAFGSAMSLLSAGGSAYCHRVLNRQHQTAANSGDAGEALPLQAQAAPAGGRLTHRQRLALLGDALSHTADIAGPLTFVANLAAPTLPRWVKGVIACGATLFGGFASVADVRTCANAMRKTNPLPRTP